MSTFPEGTSSVQMTAAVVKYLDKTWSVNCNHTILTFIYINTVATPRLQNYFVNFTVMPHNVFKCSQ